MVGVYIGKNLSELFMIMILLMCDLKLITIFKERGPLRAAADWLLAAALNTENRFTDYEQCMAKKSESTMLQHRMHEPNTDCREGLS